MKWRNKFLISLFVIPLLLLTCLICPLNKNIVLAESNGYNQKVIAVVYDDSGSMTTGSRVDYAKYAMQVLMATLDYKDVLKVFPLNASDFEVDLSKSDRNGEIADKITKLKASGGTPPNKLATAIDWLSSSQGLNKYEMVEGKEYWLIVVSDGEFTGGGKTSEHIGNQISGYVGLQTAYFGICLDDTKADIVKIDKLVSENSAVSAYYTDDAEDIVDSMQEITNKTTGRYKMTTGVSANGNVVDVDLSTCGFSVVSVSVLAQGENSSVKLSDVQCSTTELNKIRECELKSQKVGMYGYTVMLSPKNDKDYLNGDKIRLIFETEPTSVSIMLEPAIKLDSTLQYYNGTDWVDTTVEDVNTSLKKGAELRARYRLLDSNTNKDLTSILTDVNATISYNGKILGYDESFKLELGKKEVALSVIVNISGSKYTLYNSWLCDIDENPQNFRIISNMTEGVGGIKEKIKIDYTIYYDDAKVSKSDLTGNSATLSWELIELTDPAGNQVTPESAEVNDDGTISVVFRTKPGEYGAYLAKLKVVRLDNRRFRTSTVDLKYYPSSISIESGETKEMTLSSSELKKNTKNFEFTITANGYPVSFNSGVVGYTLKIDGIDVTGKATIEQNKLTFIPDDVSMTGQLQNVANRKVVLEVWSMQDSTIRASETLSLNIIKPTYVVQVIDGENTTVDIYDLKNSTAKTYFKVSIDGNWLTKEELAEFMADGTIRLDTHPFGWIFLLPTKVSAEIVEINGDAMVCCSVGTGWFTPLDSLFASFILTGEKTLTLHCGDGYGNGIITLSDVGFVSRLWRWIVIIITVYIIVHTVLWVLGFAIAKGLPKGALIQIKLNQNFIKTNVNVSSKLINVDKKAIFIWHLKRYIPFKEFRNQDSIGEYGVILQVSEDRDSVMLNNKKRVAIKLDLDDDEASEAIRKWKRNWQGYQGAAKPSLKITTKQLNSLIDDTDKEVQAGTIVGLSENYYATKNAKGKIDSIVFFKYID